MAITLNGTTGIASTGAYSSDGISFADNTPADTLVTTTGGNVGIGTSSPTSKLDVYQELNTTYTTSALNTAIVDFRNTSTTDGNVGAIQLTATGSGYVGIVQLGALQTGTGSAAFVVGTRNSGNYAERMRIDSSGNLLVGQTTTGGTGGLYMQPLASSGAAVIRWNRANTASTSYVAQFQNAGTVVGQIYYTNTATTYSTSSDYRLKENIAPMTGALDKVSALKPVTYTWKVDGSNGQGFIAHELQAVVPECVSGKKDAVDEEGNPQYQGIDTSFLVATLTAAIQEQQAIITDLKARIETLENK